MQIEAGYDTVRPTSTIEGGTFAPGYVIRYVPGIGFTPVYGGDPNRSGGGGTTGNGGSSGGGQFKWKPNMEILNPIQPNPDVPITGGPVPDPGAGGNTTPPPNAPPPRGRAVNPYLPGLPQGPGPLPSGSNEDVCSSWFASMFSVCNKQTAPPPNGKPPDGNPVPSPNPPPPDTPNATPPDPLQRVADVLQNLLSQPISVPGGGATPTVIPTGNISGGSNNLALILTLAGIGVTVYLYHKHHSHAG